MIANLTLFLTLAFHHLIIGGTLILALWLVGRVARPSGETNSWLWLTGFFLSAVLPVVAMFSLSSEVIPQSGNLTAIPPVIQGDSALVKSTEALNEANQLPWHFPAEWIATSLEVLLALLLLWLAGSVWRLAHLCRAAFKTHGLWYHPGKETLCEIRGVPVVSSDQISSPMVIGLSKPLIILPARLEQQIGPQQRQAVIEHERAHIDRRDLWFGVLQECIAVIFWWSPVIRHMNQRTHHYREIACDVRAARATNSAKHYAQSLIDSARLMIHNQENILAMGLFSKKKQLAERIDSVLDQTGRAPSGPVKIIGVCSLLAASAVWAAERHVPDVDLSNMVRDANQYSRLSQSQSEILLQAVEQRDVALVEFLVSRGTDINVPLIGDGTALMHAVRRGDTEMVERLIALGADVNQPSAGDGNPLIVAAKENRLDAAAALLAEGAEVDAHVEGDETPLIQASWNGHTQMVALLVDAGADVNLGVLANPLTRPQWRSPLNKAANNEIRDLLIRHGATADE